MLRQLVIELKGTAKGIKDLDDFLTKDQSTEQPVINKSGRADYHQVTLQCNTVFRKVAVLISKAGRSAALVAVDEFQSGVNNSVSQDGSCSEPKEFDFELSKLEHLLWPWRLPKIEQCVQDLERLRHSLGFRLVVATLGAVIRSSSKKSV